MEDNFDKFKKIMKFENEDIYYVFFMIHRGKDNNNKACIYTKANHQSLLRIWFIDSFEKLNLYKQEMKTLADVTGGRIMAYPDARSSKKTLRIFIEKSIKAGQNREDNPLLFSMSKMLSIPYSSSAVKEASVKPYYYHFDIDTKEIPVSLKKYIEMDGALLLESKNGWHLITPRNYKKPNIYEKNVEIKTNSSVLLYWSK